MTLLLFCMTIMRAPTMPSPDSGGVGGAASGVSVTYNAHQDKTHRMYLSMTLKACEFMYGVFETFLRK